MKEQGAIDISVTAEVDRTILKTVSDSIRVWFRVFPSLNPVTLTRFSGSYSAEEQPRY